MREGESIMEAVKLYNQFPKKKAHFTCGVPEEALMGRQVAPQEEAEAEGAPRLMPGCDHDYKQKKH